MRPTILLLASLPVVVALPARGQCQPPAGYYDSVDTSSSAALRATLHELIDDHTKIPYTSGATDTWNVLDLAQRDPSQSGNILDVYQNDSHPAQGGGNSFYEREHTWPASYGFPNDGPDNYPYSDCHLLFLCDPSYNAARSNKPYRTCSASCSELPTVFQNGQGGQGGGYPGDSNWTAGQFTSGTFEVWAGRRGDVARALLYAAVRYEGGFHGGTGVPEPDLRLTDDQALIAASNTGQNEAVAYMGMLSVLLQWNDEDPPDALDCWRNDVVAAFQGNRNPFVDHPEWAACVFAGACQLGESYCGPAELNSSGKAAKIRAEGTGEVAQNDFTLVCYDMPVQQFGYFLASRTEGFVMHPGGSQGNLCVTGNIARFSKQLKSSDVFGSIWIDVDLTSIPLSPPVPVLPGETWRFQCWFRDKNPTTTSNFSDGLRVTFS